MAESDKSPKPKVELGAAPKATPATGRGNAGDAGGKDGTAKGSQPSDASSAGSAAAGFSRVSAWVGKTFPGHENAVLFGFVGFLVAVLIFIIGFWRTLFIALVVVAFVAVGQCLDGDPKILRALKRALGDGRD